MGAPTASIASPPQNSGLTPVSNNGGKAGGSGKSGMSSIKPSNQTLTANTAQPAMGAPAAYSNTISPGFNSPKTWSTNDLPANQQQAVNTPTAALTKPISSTQQGINEQMETMTGMLSQYNIPDITKFGQGKGQ